MTLQDQIQMLREENKQQSSELIETSKGTTEGVRKLGGTMKELLEAFKGDPQEEAERRRDSQGKGEGPARPARPATPDIPNVNDNLFNMLLGIPTAILGFTSGLVAGWVQAIGKVTKLVMKPINGIVKLITAPFTALFDKISKVYNNTIGRAIDAVTDVFKKAGTGKFLKGDTIKVLGRFLVPLENFFNKIKDVQKTVSNAFKPITDSIKFFIATIKTSGEMTATGISDKIKSVKNVITTGVNNFIKPFQEAFGKVSNLFKTSGGAITGIVDKAKNAFAFISKTLPLVGKAFFGLGKIISSRLLAPIFALVGGIKGAMEDFAKGDYLGAAFGFVTGALNSLIFSFVDMIKNGISWVAGKLFGEDNPVTTFLNSFSFEELFSQFMVKFEEFYRSIPERVTALIDNVKEFFTGFMESEDPIAYLMEPISQMMQDIKDFVLGLIPSMDDIKSLATSGLDAVTSFFGGDDEQTPPPAPAPDIPEVSETVSATSNSVIDEIPQTTSATPPSVPSEDPAPAPTKSRKEKQIEIAERKLALSEQKLKEEPSNTARQIIYEKAKSRVSALKGEVEKPTAPAVVMEQPTPQSSIEPAETSMRMATTQAAQTESKENAQLTSQSSIAMPIVNAPQQTTTNVNNSTAAVIDNNMPTVDYNDRYIDLKFHGFE